MPRVARQSVDIQIPGGLRQMSDCAQSITAKHSVKKPKRTAAKPRQAGTCDTLPDPKQHFQSPRNKKAPINFRRPQPFADLVAAALRRLSALTTTTGCATNLLRFQNKEMKETAKRWHWSMLMCTCPRHFVPPITTCNI